MAFWRHSGQFSPKLRLHIQAVAKANNRDIIEPWDLPLAKGLQERMDEFKALEFELELKPVLQQLAPLPMLDLASSAQTEERLPEVVGGLILGLAKTFKILDPELKNPQTAHWEQALSIFGLLL